MFMLASHVNSDALIYDACSVVQIVTSRSFGAISLKNKTLKNNFFLMYLDPLFSVQTCVDRPRKRSQ